jgi:putative Mg2+ transporter-C (MgtC) family protein
MELINPDLLWPTVGAVAAGAVIGLEREYRGSPAGFRTHILVALSSALLMLAAVHQIRWLSDTPQAMVRIDPVRMAHGVLTGIGFLCGGAIFREGFNVRGLTTAASLWTTSALGILFGVGFYRLALGGTLATLLVLAAIGLTEAVIPQRRFADVKVRYRRGAHPEQSRFQAMLKSHGLKPFGISQSMQDGTVEFSTVLSAFGAVNTEALTQALDADPEVTGFDVSPHAG